MMEKKLHSFICTEDNVRIGGRTMLENDIRYMDYTCTYVEFTFTGTYAEAEIISDLTPSEDIFRSWAVVCINGSAQPAKRFKLDSKRAAYELYSSNKEETVTIRLMKVSEAAFSKMGVAPQATVSAQDRICGRLNNLRIRNRRRVEQGRFFHRDREPHQGLCL